MTSSQLTPGSVLAGRYRLDERIGRGGMADVFRGRDQLLDRDVAVKVFRFDTVDGAEQQRIEAEMRTLAAVRHPGLVTLYDAFAGDASGLPAFLVMEYISGPTLAQRLAQGPLPAADVATLGADLAAALQHVHANGIVHRDIKPANILLDEHSGRVTPKLTDFGIARLTDSARLTATGTTIGTANYLSPEQARGAAVGPASDVYALGLVLLECLTGAVAFPGSGVSAAVARLSCGPQIPQQFGAGWAGLLAAMTAMDPAARPDTETVKTALNGLRPDAATAALLASSLGAEPTVPMTPAGAVAGTAVLPSETPRSRLPLVLAAAACVAVLAAVLAIVFGSGSGAPTRGLPSGSTSTPHPSTSAVVRQHPSRSPTTPLSTSVAHRPSPTPIAPNPKPPKHKPPNPKPPKPRPKPGKKPHGHGPGHGPGPGPGHGHGGADD